MGLTLPGYRGRVKGQIKSGIRPVASLQVALSTIMATARREEAKEAR